MSWLLWKDYQLNRLIFIVALAMLVLPHGVAVIRGMPWNGEAFDFWSRLLASNLFVSSLVSLGMLQLSLALFGGNALACERVDRSTEFLAYLPFNRGRLVTSKLLVLLGLVGLIWIPNAIVLAAVGFECPLQPAFSVNVARTIATIAVTGTMAFSIAWLASSMIESPAIAVCLGLVAPLLPLAIASNIYTQEVDAYRQSANTDFFWWYITMCVAFTAMGFPSGTFIYLHRTDP